MTLEDPELTTMQSASVSTEERTPRTEGARLGIAPQIGLYYYVDMTTISLKLPERLLQQLEKECRIRHTTKSSLIRECLAKSLDDGPAGGKASCYDLARDLAGCIKGKGLPRDLATNPKYLEGLGR